MPGTIVPQLHLVGHKGKPIEKKRRVYLKEGIRSKAILESRLMSSGTVISLLALPSSRLSSI